MDHIGAGLAALGVIGPGIGIGILTGHKLEGFGVFAADGVEQRNSLLWAEITVEAKVSGEAINSLRGVGIQGTGIEIGTVGQLIRISSQKAADDKAGSGVGGQRSSLIARRDQDVSVDHTANLASAKTTCENAEAGYRPTEANTVLVAMGGQHGSHLKISAGVERRVLMEIKKVGVPGAGALAGSEQDGFRGRLAVLGGKIADFHRGLGDHNDGTAQTNIRLFLSVVIDLVDLNVFVALSGTGRGGVGNIVQHRFGRRHSRGLFGWRRNLLRPSGDNAHKSSEYETGWDGLQAI